MKRNSMNKKRCPKNKDMYGIHYTYHVVYMSGNNGPISRIYLNTDLEVITKKAYEALEAYLDAQILAVTPLGYHRGTDTCVCLTDFFEESEEEA